MKDYEWKIEMKRVQDFFEMLSPSMDNYLYLYDMKMDIYCISPNALERFAIPAAQFDKVEENLAKFVHPADFPVLKESLSRIRDKRDNFHNLEYRWLNKTGKVVWISCRGQVLLEDDQPRFLVGCINEIGKEQKADNISGLRREASFFQELLNYGDRRISGFAVRIGIDGFKEINENRGIDYGDMVLQKTAECIEAVILPEQKLYRIVSDEFVISDFTGRCIEEAKELYRRIGYALDRFIQENHYEVFFTVSAGIVQLDELADQSYINLMKLTEFSLNMAKEKGRNQYYLYQEEDYVRFSARRRLAQILRQAVNNDFAGFETYFQPIMDIREQRLCSAETLLRFHNEESGTVSPAEFIPILEDSGLIIPVGIWVIEQAVKTCIRIQEYIPNFRVSVNLSYIQVLKSNVLGEIINIVDKYQLKPNSLMMEMTESGLLEDNPKFNRFCQGLREHGILLALDDFGSGYSNFRYLFHLSPHALKVDRTFTMKAINNEQEYTLLKYMVEMSHSINLKMCIEGVETLEELNKICQMQPDYIQGFFFGKPCPLNVFMEKHVFVTVQP